MSIDYFCLDVAKLPDELYTPETPVEEWLKLCKTAGPEGFAPGELGQESYLCALGTT